jgi:hypothetical protein
MAGDHGLVIIAKAFFRRPGDGLMARDFSNIPGYADVGCMRLLPAANGSGALSCRISAAASPSLRVISWLKP